MSYEKLTKRRTHEGSSVCLREGQQDTGDERDSGKGRKKETHDIGLEKGRRGEGEESGQQ